MERKTGAIIGGLIGACFGGFGVPIGMTIGALITGNKEKEKKSN